LAAEDVAARRKPSSAPSPASEAGCVPCACGGSGPWLTRDSEPPIRRNESREPVWPLPPAVSRAVTALPTGRRPPSTLSCGRAPFSSAVYEPSFAQTEASLIISSQRQFREVLGVLFLVIWLLPPLLPSFHSLHLRAGQTLYSNFKVKFFYLEVLPGYMYIYLYMHIYICLYIYTHIYECIL